MIALAVCLLMSVAHATDETLTCDLLLATPYARVIQARAARVFAADDADPEHIAGYVGVSLFEVIELLNTGGIVTEAASPWFHAVEGQCAVERFRDRPYSDVLELDTAERDVQMQRARDDAWVRSVIDLIELRRPGLDLHDAAMVKYLMWRRTGMDGANPAPLRIRELVSTHGAALEHLPTEAGVTLGLSNASLYKVAWGRVRLPFIPRVELRDVLEITPHSHAEADFLFELGRRFR